MKRWDNGKGIRWRQLGENNMLVHRNIKKSEVIDFIMIIPSPASS
jgi:hypothetical protein